MNGTNMFVHVRRCCCRAAAAFSWASDGILVQRTRGLFASCTTRGAQLDGSESPRLAWPTAPARTCRRHMHTHTRTHAHACAHACARAHDARARVFFDSQCTNSALHSRCESLRSHEGTIMPATVHCGRSVGCVLDGCVHVVTRKHLCALYGYASHRQVQRNLPQARPDS